MHPRTQELERYQKFFLAVLSIISLIGIIMVYSSSYILAKDLFGNSGHYFIRQLIYFCVSIGLAFVLSKTKISFWLKYSYVFNFLVMLLVIATFIPGIGVTIKGANRWILMGPLGFQPGELLKFTVLLASVNIFENFFSYTTRERVLALASIISPMIMVVLQPDFGTFSICFMVISVVCFFSSFPRKIFYTSLVSGILLLIPILMAQPYRVRRLFAYLDPWKNAKGSGFQIIQSYLAFANGSIFGQGLGNSNEKLFYLPEAHNDFIFSVIGEELGFLGVFILTSLFVLFIYSGYRIALVLQGKKPFILVSAIISLIGLQAFLNMAVVLGLLPTKGLNLPFVSSGGSSLIANFFAVGLVFSAIRDQREKDMALTTSYSSGTSNYPSYENSQGSYSEGTQDNIFGNL